jgi:hypothetical protein
MLSFFRSNKRAGRTRATRPSRTLCMEALEVRSLLSGNVHLLSPADLSAGCAIYTWADGMVDDPSVLPYRNTLQGTLEGAAAAQTTYDLSDSGFRCNTTGVLTPWRHDGPVDAMVGSWNSIYFTVGAPTTCILTGAYSASSTCMSNDSILSVFVLDHTTYPNPFVVCGKWHESGLTHDIYTLGDSLTGILVPGVTYEFIYNHTFSATALPGSEFSTASYVDLAFTTASSDIAATSLQWNTENAGVDAKYSVTGGSLTQATTAALYWATGTTKQTIIGKGGEAYPLALDHPVVVPPHPIPAGTATGDTFFVANSDLGTPPPGATHLILFVDPTTSADPDGKGLVEESQENNNTAMIPYYLPSLVFRDSGRLLSVPGIDHVGFFPGGAGKVLESVPGYDPGDYFDPDPFSEPTSVPVTWRNGVQQQQTRGSFFYDAILGHASPVASSREIPLYDSSLAEAMSSWIKAHDGAPYLEWYDWVGNFILGPEFQKGLLGNYSCVGLVERAAEVVTGTDGFIPNAMESIAVGPARVSTLSPSLLYWCASSRTAVSQAVDWLIGVLDPVDFIITDPLGRRFGYTACTGLISEIPGILYTGDGRLEQFLILDPLPGRYSLDLYGLGGNAVAAMGTRSLGNYFSGFLPEGDQTTVGLTVGNQTPVMGTLEDKTAAEGSGLTLAVAAADPDGGDTLTFSLDAAPAGAIIDPATGVFTWMPADGPATAEVTVRVTDSGTPPLSDVATFTITVNNVPPVMSSLSTSAMTPGAAGEGQTVTLAGRFTDAGVLDSHTATIDWGDGTTGAAVIEEADGAGSLSGSHVYAAGGLYSALSEKTTYVMGLRP